VETSSTTSKPPESIPPLPIPAVRTNSPREFLIPFRFDYIKNGKFTGRKELLNEVHRQLSGTRRDFRSNILALYGPGGIGKTQIAIEYAHLHHTNYSSVFWIDATNQKSAFDSFLQIAKRILRHYVEEEIETSNYGFIARKLGLVDLLDENGRFSMMYGDSYGIAEALKDWFAKEANTEWLLIFDNVDGLETFDIRDFFPRVPWGSILITTRRRDIPTYWNSIEVQEMSQIEGLQFLKRCANLDQELSHEGRSLHICII
jgi:Cdc6-like AAA superfamily ATPase